MHLALMPLRTVLFPGIALPLVTYEERYRRMVRECVAAEQPFGVVLIRSGQEEGGLVEPYPVGTTARILRARESDSGAMFVLAIGEKRFRVESLQIEGDLLRAKVSLWGPGEGPVSAELCKELQEMLNRHLRNLAALAGLPDVNLALEDDPDRLSYVIAAQLTAPPRVHQQLLEMPSTAERLVAERPLLQREIEDYEVLLRAINKARSTQPQPCAEGGFLSVN